METHLSFNSNSTLFGGSIYISLSKVGLNELSGQISPEFIHAYVGDWRARQPYLGHVSIFPRTDHHMPFLIIHQSHQCLCPSQLAAIKKESRNILLTKASCKAIPDSKGSETDSPLPTLMAKAAKSHCIEKGMQTLKCE